LDSICEAIMSAKRFAHPPASSMDHQRTRRQVSFCFGLFCGRSLTVPDTIAAAMSSLLPCSMQAEQIHNQTTNRQRTFQVEGNLRSCQQALPEPHLGFDFLVRRTGNKKAANGGEYRYAPIREAGGNRYRQPTASADSPLPSPHDRPPPCRESPCWAWFQSWTLRPWKHVRASISGP